MSVVAELASVAALALVLIVAMVRPRRVPEAAVALPAAGLLVALHAVAWRDAWHQLSALLPVVGFLAAVLAFAKLCDDDGLFVALGDRLARGNHGQPIRLLGGVFAVASIVTAALSLDATVVLLTPVVFVAAARAGARPEPQVYACTHLANTASLLLPVSNLTNLLALTAAGVGFTKFAGLMALPWLVAIAVEYAVFRRFFRHDLAAHEQSDDSESQPGPTPVPRLAVIVLVLTLAGFVVTSAVHVNPAWAALAGVLVLAAPALAKRRLTPGHLVAAANPLFCLFVLGLGVIVTGVVDNGVGSLLNHLVPQGDSLLALLAVAALAAVLSNLINNLPAVLALLPVAAAGGTGPILAVLIGVNVGPNLTYVGSLATLLWRRIVSDHDADPGLASFTRLGLLTVPAGVVAATVALWGSLQVLGG